ncbi:pyridoxamine 5'-phosphate oxidase family protein [Streptomyces sp. YIM 98790]|uniref:pyridoxamine 5'-phosphate oxidase family protein n=1 Tax=Streptomyces sp. YIM 98790 TaxID=2689077 RepID=UPI001407944D|nr:pyridoxamine 5'-phosphate oxidase family protein [Streptomyces sp. YIM 98790]
MYLSGGFRDLDRAECLRLMARVPVGRVVYTEDALPAIRPVNFWLDRDGTIVLRTSASSRIARSVAGGVAAFEVDEFDPGRQDGWSVVVTGRASLVTDPSETARLRNAAMPAWAAIGDEVFLRIEPEIVTGRVLCRPDGTARAADPA